MADDQPARDDEPIEAEAIHKEPIEAEIIDDEPTVPDASKFRAFNGAFHNSFEYFKAVNWQAVFKFVSLIVVAFFIGLAKAVFPAIGDAVGSASRRSFEGGKDCQNCGTFLAKGNDYVTCPRCGAKTY